MTDLEKVREFIDLWKKIEFDKERSKLLSETRFCDGQMYFANRILDYICEIKREGKNIYYSLSDRHLLNIIKCINNCKSI